MTKRKPDPTAWATLPGTEDPSDEVRVRLAAGLVPLLEPIDAVRPDPANPRITRDLGALVASMRRFGVRKPIVVNRRDKTIEAGHQTLAAVRAVGGTHLPVVWVDDERMEAVGFNIADNRTAEVVAEWDGDALSKLLGELRAEDEGLCVGWNPAALDEAISGLRPGSGSASDGSASGDDEGGFGGGVAEDDGEHVSRAQELRAEWKTAPGQLWALGEHRLLCGDSTRAEDVKRLMGNEKADLVVTDPPYGVSYADKNEFLNSIDKGNCCQSEIENDHRKPEEMLTFWKSTWRATTPHLADHCSYYMTGPQGGDLLLLLLSLRDEGWTLKHMLIWAKNNHVLGRCDYHYKHEPIIYGWMKKHIWHGDSSQTSLWEIPRPSVSKEHPTMKPIEVFARAMRNSSKSGDVIYDPFSGSGTSTLAAEQLGRRCRAMEIDPSYVAVALQRWSELTGRTPTLLT